MHVLTSNVLAIERFLPTTFIGILLGWVAIRTGSIWPGMLLHALHNGLLLSMNHWQEELKQWDVLGSDTSHFPATWLLVAGVTLGTGLLVLGWKRKAPGQDVQRDPVRAVEALEAKQPEVS